MASSTTISTRVRTDALSAVKTAPARRAPADDSTDSSFEHVLQNRKRPDADEQTESRDPKTADKTLDAKKPQKTEKKPKVKKPVDAEVETENVAASPTDAEVKVEDVEVADKPDEAVAVDVQDEPEQIKPVAVKTDPSLDVKVAVNPATQKVEQIEQPVETDEAQPARVATSKPKTPAANVVQEQSPKPVGENADAVEAVDEDPQTIEAKPETEDVKPMPSRPAKPQAAVEKVPSHTSIAPLSPAPLEQNSGNSAQHQQQSSRGKIEIDPTQLDDSDLEDRWIDLPDFAPIEKKPLVAVDDAATFAIDASVKPADHHATSAPVVQPQTPPEVRFAEDNHPQIVTNVRGQLLPNGGTMAIRLDPPELGDLQLLVHMNDGVMSAAFQTSNDQATHLLSHSLGELRTALEASGISVDRLHVEQAPKDQHARNDNPDARHQQGQTQDSPARRDQQRRELLDRMWKKLAGDDLDLVA